jgi:hypothetical protein
VYLLKAGIGRRQPLMGAAPTVGARVHIGCADQQAHVARRGRAINAAIGGVIILGVIVVVILVGVPLVVIALICLVGGIAHSGMNRLWW